MLHDKFAGLYFMMLIYDNVLLLQYYCIIEYDKYVVLPFLKWHTFSWE